MTTAPEPEIDTFDGTGSPKGWWTEYGGELDPVSGVIKFRRGALPPCRVPACQRCAGREGA